MSPARCLSIPLLVCALCAPAAPGAAQTRGATRTAYREPVYPDEPNQKDSQGNVLLIGRIDAKGNVTELHMISATAREFVQPALEAVREWKFQPALRDGKAIEIPLNAGVRFRKTGSERGVIPVPILGDLAVYPADASGARTAPDAFPIRRGKDPALRAEALLDVPPSEQPRTMTIRVEAISPKGKRIPIFQPPLAVPALATEVKFPVVARVGSDWDEGVWILTFTADGKGAGGGQFWLASDPEHFSFVLPVSAP
ncbi:MAG: energy transducer TonB [Thermoanaerobaculia bacterium]